MKRYSFLDTIMIVNGNEITGWAEGEDLIDIERRNPSVSDKVGAGGEMMASVSADKSGMVKIKLQQTSSSNRLLSDIVDLQESAGSNFEPISLRFSDTYRQDYASGTQGYIVKPASMKRGATATNIEWEFVVERLDLLFGDV